jgi:agmatinase
MSQQSNRGTGEARGYRDIFLGAELGGRDGADARVTLVPVPYDSTTSYKSGARHGPRAIITASQQLEDYDLELDRDISEVGIYTAPEVAPDASGPRAMVERVEGVVRSLSAPGKLIGLLGGEHSVTTGAVRALRESYSDLSVLYMDAHADLRDEYMDTPWGHASVARRLHEMCPLVEVGVRSLSTEERRFIREAEVPVVFWPPDGMSVDEISARALEALSDQVYVSIDLDVLDPSLMAAVGTPEPGGMAWEEVTGVVRAVAAQRRIVGFDVTELSPGEGPEACAFIAAKLVYKLIGYATSNGRQQPS